METTDNYNPNEGKGCFLATILLTLILSALSLTMRSQNLKITNKDKHFLVSSNISCTGSIILFKITDKEVLSCAGGVLLSAGIGYCKERFYDGMMRKGVEDYKGDFVADVKGALTGAFIAAVSMAVKQNIKDKRELRYFEYKQKFEEL